MALKVQVRIDAVDNVTKKIDQINNKIEETSSLTNESGKLMSYWPKTIQDVINKSKKLNKEFKESDALISDMGSKLKGIFAAYGGVMTIRAVIETSDIITGSENRLNYVNGGDTAATEEAMDKMYAASLRSRSNYGDMLSNVGKSMALAGGAFQDNVDNAIRFQEVMTKSYAIGGSSAAEQHSSMYQMIQALGSGRLQGDELRSVREGAPLAYQAIEEFAQGIYDTDESLKDLASQGKITSDIVVAAMMQAGDGIDKAFEDTNMTISQAFTNMKTTAINSFRPIQDTINSFLNSDTGEKFINGINIAIQFLMGALNILVTMFVKVASWLVDNWYWVQWIIYAIGIAIVYVAVVAIGKILWRAIVKVAATGALAWLPWLFVIAGVIGAIIYLANTAKSGCEFIYNVFHILAIGIIGILAVVLAIYLATGTVVISTTMMVALIIVSVIALLLMVFMQYTGQIMGGIYVVGAFFKNVWFSILNIGKAIGQALCQVWENFKQVFVNVIAHVQQRFWGFVNNVTSGILKIANLINKVLGVFGLEIDTSGLEKMVDFAKGKAETAEAKQQEVDWGSVGDSWKTGMSTYDTWQDGWVQDSYGSGYSKGMAIQNSINLTFDNIKNKVSGVKTNLQNKLDDKLNVDRNFNPNDPSSLAKGIGDTADNTGKMADSMKLAEEDLEYLRSVADMEWKKEFTTASITVDMSNYNTISGESDLDGIVTKLADKLYEELDSVANGVYA